MGVRRAVDLVLEAATPKSGKLSTIGPLVHNPQVVELLEVRNVMCASDVGDFREGTAVIRSHGVPLETERDLLNRGLNLLDATCPKVKAVQKIIAKQSDQGRQVIIVGDEDHPEVKALLSYADGRGIAVAGPDELPDELAEPLCLVAQTTQDQEMFAEVERRVRDNAGADVVVRNTICDATRSRQDEVRRLSSSVDAMVVVGGRNSGNTKRLAQIAGKRVRTFHVEYPSEVEQIDLSGVERLGVTAGASTPSWVIEQVLDRLHERARMESAGPLRRLGLKLMAALRAAQFSGIVSGAAAAALAYLFFKATWTSPTALPLFLAWCFVLFMHLINRLGDVDIDQYRDEPARYRFMKRRRQTLRTLCLVSGFASIVAAAALGWPPALVVIITAAIGVTYSLPIFPRALANLVGASRLKDLAASKNVLVALGWTLITAVPIIHITRPGIETALSMAIALVIATWLRSLLFDLVEVSSDKIAGRETIPTVIGLDRSRMAARLAAIGLGLWIGCCSAIGWMHPAFLLLAVILIIEGLTARKPRRMNSVWAQTAVDAHFIAAAILVGIIG